MMAAFFCVVGVGDYDVAINWFNIKYFVVKVKLDCLIFFCDAVIVYGDSDVIGGECSVIEVDITGGASE
jgi:hypothetical protein